MILTQHVQVKFLGSDRLYSYEWVYELGVGEALAVGDRVEVPPNFVQEEGGSGIVAQLGSTYTGAMARIVRKIPSAP